MNVSDREKRDLLLLAGIVFFGVILMFVAGQFAVRLLPSWNVSSDMGSKIEISGELANVSAVGLAPLRPEILTPPVWQRTFLTPLADDLDELNEVPVVVIAPVTVVPTRVATSQTQPTQASGATATATQAPTLTPFPTNTLFYVFPTSTFTPRPPTSTFTRTVTPSMTLTRTPTFTSTITSTRTSTFTPTFTPTWTATFTSTFTATNSPSPTATATNTFTPSPTFTASPSPTITFTPSPTFTASPTATNTFTPSPTFTNTPTFTPIATDTIPGNIGTSPDGNIFTLSSSGTLTLGITMVVNGNSGPDLILYERVNGLGINMDLIVITASQDGHTWYPVFNWGDGAADTNSNLNIAGSLGGTEYDDRDILASYLYPSGIYGDSGVTMDLDMVLPPGTYNYLRIYSPPSADNVCDIDAIQVLP